MIKEIPGFDKYIGITGIRCVRIEDAKSLVDSIQKKAKGIPVQLFDASLIAGPEHLYFATLNALKAFESDMNTCKKLALEILLYASARRQIKKAVELLGVKDVSSDVAILVVAETEAKVCETLKVISDCIQGVQDDKVVELSDTKVEAIKELFAISKLELEAKSEKRDFEKEALIDLVIEHMALLATER